MSKKPEGEKITYTPTETGPEYYLKNVDCQYACPAHTDVPGYIRLIAEGRYEDAYLLNRNSNVFPGILGRVCDRPCEPACRRGRLPGEEPVAICRLKRFAADNSDQQRIDDAIPKGPFKKRGLKVAVIGAGPASLTVANDLLPLGFHVTLFEKDQKLGGAMRRAVPAFRLPMEVLEKECDYIVRMGLELKLGQEVTQLSEIMKDFDAVFVGTGAPLGRDLPLEGREAAAPHVHIGLKWLADVSFKHVKTIGKKVVVIGGGNTAMDCCRTALRLGAESVTVVAPESYEQMLASPWEKEDAEAEGVEVRNNLLPKLYAIGQDQQLSGVAFQPLTSLLDQNGKWDPQPEPNSQLEVIAADDVILAIGQNTAYGFIDAASGVKTSDGGVPEVHPETLQSSVSKVFFGGDAAFGPKNIITAVAHGHSAAISIVRYLEQRPQLPRPPLKAAMESLKMGLHEWSYPNNYAKDTRFAVPHLPLDKRFSNLEHEVELGFTENDALKEAMRCLNCDVQTVFTAATCIECDACIDICPTDCLTLTPGNDDLTELSSQLKAPITHPESSILQSTQLPTKRAMIKDENVCLHCGLCAERCPTGAWDMQHSALSITHAATDSSASTGEQK